MIPILGMGIASQQDVERFRMLPQFRKATRNMMLATAAVEKALEGIELKNQSVSIVLGSSYGELEVTKEFLKSFTLEQWARPLLFQNSLHNAIVGHLAQYWKVQGPSITVSHRYFTGEKSLETAVLLLETEVTDLCIVVAVDTLVPELLEGMRRAYPESVELSEGAAAVLMASTHSKVLETKTPKIFFQSIDYRSEGQLPKIPFYDSDGIEQSIRAFRTVPEHTSLTLHKPDQTCSILRWEYVR